MENLGPMAASLVLTLCFWLLEAAQNKVNKLETKVKFFVFIIMVKASRFCESKIPFDTAKCVFMV